MYGLDQEVIQKISTVFNKHSDVEKVILYGSRAKETFRYNSDIDLSMVGSEVTLEMQYTIELELDDLLLPYKIDLSIFHHIDNENLIAHINQVGKLFYTSEKAVA